MNKNISPPIRLFYHTTFLNDYLDITKYLFDKVVESGLHDACEGIYIGCLGDENELPKFKELIAKYPKAQIVDYSPDKGQWELFTIQHLKKDADTLPKFYAWYFHSKSVTYPINGDGDTKTPAHKRSEIFWRDSMAHELITRWEVCYKAMDMPEYGYDVCGSRMIPKRASASIYSHASGNFWAANSEYIKTLNRLGNNPDLPDIEAQQIALRRQIDELKKEGETKIRGNIFGAEHYVWEQQPLTYIAGNSFTVGFPSEQGTFEEYIKKNDLSKYRTHP